MAGAWKLMNKTECAWNAPVISVFVLENRWMPSIVPLSHCCIVLLSYCLTCCHIVIVTTVPCSDPRRTPLSCELHELEPCGHQSILLTKDFIQGYKSASFISLILPTSLHFLLLLLMTDRRTDNVTSVRYKRGTKSTDYRNEDTHVTNQKKEPGGSSSLESVKGVMNDRQRTKAETETKQKVCDRNQKMDKR